MKIEYTLSLMHGDGDCYNQGNFILTDINKIQLIDYLIEIEFHKEKVLDLGELEKCKQKKIFELFKNTDWYTYEIEDKFELIDKISDALVDLDYLVYDETDNGNFAIIKSINREVLK